MIWSENRRRIRRMLRDPDGNIWSDNLLLRLWNDAHDDFQMTIGSVEDVKVVKIPSQFQMSYTQDFEWAYSDHSDGDVRLVGYYDDYSDENVTNLWEIQHNQGITPDISSLGTFCPHPWEGWMDTPNEPPPVHFPEGFEESMAIFFDKEPLDPMTLRQVQRSDPSYRQREGRAFAYYRDEEYENRAYLYPKPTNIVWGDTYYIDPGIPDYTPGDPLTDTDAPTITITSPTTESTYDNGIERFVTISGTASDNVGIRHVYFAGVGSVVPTPSWGFASGTENWTIENLRLGYGDNIIYVFAYDTANRSAFKIITITYSGSEEIDNAQEGDPDSSLYSPYGLDVDSNMLVVFKKRPSTISDGDGESDYPEFLLKYLESYVISLAYRMNTDGRIESLADYWDTRKAMGMNIIKRYLSRRHQDRTYILGQSSDTPRTMRHPRLPDEYPEVNP